MASEAPLLLWRIDYKEPHPAFTYPDEPALGPIASAFGAASDDAMLRGALTHTMRTTLLDDAAAASAGAHGGGTPVKSKRAYVPLLQRASMASVAERAEQHERREARKRGRAASEAGAPGGTTPPAEAS